MWFRDRGVNGGQEEMGCDPRHREMRRRCETPSRIVMLLVPTAWFCLMTSKKQGKKTCNWLRHGPFSYQSLIGRIQRRNLMCHRTVTFVSSDGTRSTLEAFDEATEQALLTLQFSFRSSFLVLGV